MSRRACGICKAPAAIKFEVEDMGLRRQVPLRTIAEYLAAQGHAFSKDVVSKHNSLCVTSPPAGQIEPTTPADRVPALLVALAAADVLQGWESRANLLAARLHGDGLHDAAELVVCHVEKDYRYAFEATAGTPVTELLSERVLARAVGAVLASTAPDVSAQIADLLGELGADELAAAFRDLAAQAIAAQNPDTTTPQEALA